MQRTINTITDARNLVLDWAGDAELTEGQINRASRALVDFIGGYGNVAGGEATEGFDFWGSLGE